MNREKEIALEEKRTSVNIALSSEDKVFLKATVKVLDAIEEVSLNVAV